MTHIQNSEVLIKEYLAYRGFTNCLKSFELECRSDKNKSFRTDKILVMRTENETAQIRKLQEENAKLRQRLQVAQQQPGSSHQHQSRQQMFLEKKSKSITNPNEIIPFDIAPPQHLVDDFFIIAQESLHMSESQSRGFKSLIRNISSTSPVMGRKESVADGSKSKRSGSVGSETKQVQNMSNPVDLFFGDHDIEAPKPQFVAKFKIEPNKNDIKKRKRDDNSDGFEYSIQHRIKQEKRMHSTLYNLNIIKKEDSDSEEDFGIECKIENLDLPELNVYSRYNFNIPPKKLPILDKREMILNAIDRNPVIILTASAGTGKTSQVPQYILEESRKKGVNCNIIITQPRRIAATTVAKRVADERKCECGSLVGYQIGLEKQLDIEQNSDTRILYCTTGVLLQKLINDKSMRRYSHIILDEVHERKIDMDMLLIVIQLLLSRKNPTVKIILMSATIRSEKFANYFKTSLDKFGVGTIAAPILNLNLKQPFTIKIQYLDHLKSKLGVEQNILEISNPKISSNMYELAVNVIEFLVLKCHGKDFKPSFLVFLPGIQEINRFKNMILASSELENFQISILHSSIPLKDYVNAFNTSIDYKIILATNIAESSVTLPGIRYVIDFCLTKYKETDTATGITQLKVDWASKNSLIQRAGRVGRLEFGIVVRLIFEHQFNEFAEESKPEMQCVSLESIIPKTKQLGMGKPSNILALALDPPRKESIRNSILVLKEIGALTKYKRGKFDAEDGELTFIGDVITKLPLDVRISKLIVLGYMFSCLEDCVIIGCGLSSKNIFKQLPKNATISEATDHYKEQLTLGKGSGSDLILLFNAYREWQKAVREGLSGANEKKWCEMQYLDLRNLREMHELILDVKKRLSPLKMKIDEDFYDFTGNEKIFMIKICIAGAFFPNFYQFGGSAPDRDVYRMMNNLNPLSTVYFNKMPLNRIGKLYEQQVRDAIHNANIVDNGNEIKAYFDKNSSRIQVEFRPVDDKRSFVPGEVQFEVYSAMKMSKLDRGIELKIMDSSQEIEYATETNLVKVKNEKWEYQEKLLKASQQCIYPKLHHRFLTGVISHIENCGKFFFQPEKGINHIEIQQKLLENNCIQIQSLQETIDGNRLLLKHESVFKRCKIIEHPDEDDEIKKFRVLLIDYGKVIEGADFEDFYTCNQEDIVTRKEILQDVNELPVQCIECRLSNISPSPIKCPLGWSEESTEEFKKSIQNQKVKIEVLSFIDRIASVRVITTLEVTRGCHIVNDYMILKGFAHPSDECYMRLIDRLERDKRQKRNYREYRNIEDELADNFVKSPPLLYLTEKIKIDGPFSPLESQIYSVQRNDLINIKVEDSSINHVLLDPFPNDDIKKLLVAASVSQKENHVTLHHTTILPNVNGMACLLALIFSPHAEVRCASNKHRFTSILAGLGCDQEQVPNFEEHDSLIHVDVELSEIDFKDINDLRKNMSTLLEKNPVIKSEHSGNLTLRKKIIDLMYDIMTRERKSLKISYDACKWNWNDPEEFKYYVEEVYPPITQIGQLLPLSKDTKEELLKHVKELEREARGSCNEIITCRLSFINKQRRVMGNPSERKKSFTVKVTQLKISKPFLKVNVVNVEEKCYKSLSKLHELYDEAEGKDIKSLGEVCIANIEPGIYERCVVTQINAVDETVSLSFIDTGYNGILQRKKLRPFPSSSSLKKMASVYREVILAHMIIDITTDKNYREKLIPLHDLIIGKQFEMSIIGQNEAGRFAELKLIPGGTLIDFVFNHLKLSQILKPIKLELQIQKMLDTKKHVDQFNNERGFNLNTLAESPEKNNSQINFSMIKPHSVRITAYDSNEPLRFYVQFTSQDDEYQKFQLNLQSLKEKLTHFHPIPPAGTKCLVIKDKEVFRAIVRLPKKIIPRRQILVHLLENGASVIVQPNQIFEIPKEVADVKPFAQQFKLNGCEDIRRKGLLWSEIEFYFQHITKQKLLTLKIVSQEGPVPSCKLYHETTEIFEELENWDPNSLRYPPDNILLDKEYQITVTTVISLNQFYTQISKGSEANQLESLCEKLSLFNSPVLRNPMPGEACIIKSENENIRGIVTGRSTSRILTVKAVDYGFSEEYAEHEVRIIVKDLLKYPPFAYRCCLRHSMNNEVTETATRDFKNACIQFTEFQMKIQRFTPEAYIVDLEELRDGQNIVNFLNGVDSSIHHNSDWTENSALSSNFNYFNRRNDTPRPNNSISVCTLEESPEKTLENSSLNEDDIRNSTIKQTAFENETDWDLEQSKREATNDGNDDVVIDDPWGSRENDSEASVEQTANKNYIPSSSSSGVSVGNNECHNEKLERVRITAVTTINDFTIQKISDINSYNLYRRELQASAQAQQPLTWVYTNSYCLAWQPFNEEWCRAIVKDADINDMNKFLVTVKCLDDGTSFTIDDRSKLKQTNIPILFKNCFGLQCSLPVRYKARNEDESTKYLTDLVRSENLSFKVISKMDDTNIIELFHNGKNVGDELVARKIAVRQVVVPNGLAIIRHVNNTQDFSIQMLNDGGLLQKVNSYIEKYTKVSVRLPDSGKIVLAQLIENSRWNRAKILHRKENGHQVYFIDLGCEGSVRNIGEITDQNILDIPPLAYRCAHELPFQVKQFSDVIEKKFKDKFKNGNRNVDVVLRKPGDRKAQVKLVDNESAFLNNILPQQFDLFNAINNAEFVSSCDQSFENES
ncbi:CLUMA_CG019088, isoform A [Clunio marinus]|uniref:Probable ATP-dependent RNA helicase spindle-E n=1 Tax=Clunio marinus TaxID=568069 RepID=A0A1J1J309_9DIPT|nr:CLUMA_CG019088, isoform A [Clunio marinus]